MPKKHLLNLSDVHLKVINELEVLTDVLASTFLQIGGVIKAYSEEVSELTDTFSKSNSSWRPQAQCWELLYFPFTGPSVIKRYKVESLEQIFCVTGQSTLEKTSDKTILNTLQIRWGFKYEKGDDPHNLFYVEIEIDKTPDGAVFTEKEYKNLTKRLKETLGIKEDDFFNYDLPDNGTIESFGVWLDFSYSERLADFFQICKDELIKEFLSRLGDKESLKKGSQKSKR
jgi:hypothetical protein